VNVFINNFLDGRGACYIAYSQFFNMLYLVGDAGGGLSLALQLGGTGRRVCEKTLFAHASTLLRASALSRECDASGADSGCGKLDNLEGSGVTGGYP
jgi:hypothetical protein